MSSEKFYIPSLDGIRAVAAMLVFVGHAGWGHIVPAGFGVTIFFFLSGYLITTLLRREYEHTNSISFKNFYLRRIYRIFPPLYIVLLFIGILALAGLVKHQMRPEAVLSQVFFWTNYYNITHGGEYFVPSTGVYWSLAIEEHFYFLFPLLFFYSAKYHNHTGTARLFIILCALALFWRSWLFLVNDTSWRYIYAATDTRYDSLLYGCLMGVWKNPMLDQHKGEEKIGFKEYAILAGGLSILLGALLIRNEEFRHTLRYTLQGIGLFPFFWLAVKHPDWWIFRPLNWRPIRFLGVVSFTFYLIHYFFLQIAAQTFESRIQQALFGFTLSLAFSIAMYRLVEQPMARLRKRLHKD